MRPPAKLDTRNKEPAHRFFQHIQKAPAVFVDLLLGALVGLFMFTGVAGGVYFGFLLHGHVARPVQRRFEFFDDLFHTVTFLVVSASMDTAPSEARRAGLGADVICGSE